MHDAGLWCGIENARFTRLRCLDALGVQGGVALLHDDRGYDMAK
jgi:hypothetical protein